MNGLQVKDVMTHLVVTFKAEEPLTDAAKRLAHNSISGGPVVEGGKVIGMISEADVIAGLMPPVRNIRAPSILDYLTILGRMRPKADRHGMTVGDVMTEMVFEIGPTASIWEAASLLERRGVKRLPVVDDEDFLLGIVSRADLVRAMARTDPEIQADVERYASILGEENFSELKVLSDHGVVTLTGEADRRSTKELLTAMVARTPGVAEVVDRLLVGFDDSGTVHSRSRIDPRLNWTVESHEPEEVRP